MTSELPILLKASPSQYEVFENMCPRKWWYRYVRGCEEPRKPFQAYGTQHHAVLERYLKADQNGRDPKTGRPVELYPEGWDKGLTPREADQIRRLVEQAIADGVLRRPAGKHGDHYLVEKRYTRTVRTLPSGIIVENGVIDLLHAGGIDDHKTTKARKWAKREHELRKDPQMLSYGVIWQEGQENPPDECELRHNVYVKEGLGHAFARSVLVTHNELEARRQKTIETVDEMLRLAQLPDEAWEEVPGPHPHSKDACNAYGGCPYRMMCPAGGGKQAETPAMYRARMESAKAYAADAERRQAVMASAEEAARSAPGPVVRKSLATLLGRREEPAPSQTVADVMAAAEAHERAEAEREEQEVSPGPAIDFTQPAPVNPPQQEAPATRVEGEASAAASHAPPPWWSPSCRACSGNPYLGWDSKLNPCKICQVRAVQEDKPTAAEFATGVDNGVPWYRSSQPAPDSPPLVVEIERLRAGAVQKAVDDKVDAELAARAAAPPQDPPAAAAPPSQKPAGATIAPPADSAPAPSAPKRRGRPPGSGKKAPGGVPASEVGEEALRPSALIDVTHGLIEEAIEQMRTQAELQLSATIERFEVALTERLLVLGAEDRALPEAQVVDEATVEVGKDLLRSAQDEIEALRKELRRAENSEAALISELQQARDRIDSIKGDVEDLTRSHPKGGFELFIGCRVTGGGKESAIDFMQILHEAGQQLAEQHRASSYYALKAFDRRDMLAQLAPEMARQLEGKVVYALGCEGVPDAMALLAALRPLAARVVEA